MNNSKKLQTKKVKKVKVIDQQSLKKVSVPGIIISTILVVGLIVGLLFDQLYQPTLLKVDGKSYTMSDLSFYFYNVEAKYSYYDQMFGGNGVYWDSPYNGKSGPTVRDEAKNQAIQAAIYNEALYNQAKSEGYVLTDTEKNDVKTKVDDLMKNQLTPDQISKNHYTKAYLTKIFDKSALVERYRTDKITALKIDKDKIKAGVSYEDNREYDIQYLFISTKKTDANNQSVDMTADEKKAALDKITAVADTAKTTADWSTLIPKDETDLTYTDTAHFTKTDSSFSADMNTTMMAMENGAVSGILEDPAKGYYVVKMVNNNSSASYDTAVQNAITQEEDTEFNDLYTKDLLPKHPYTINQKQLDKYTMGTITL